MEKNRLNILILSQYFWPENFRINDLTKYLSTKKHNVEILTGIPNYPDGKVFENFFKKKKFFYKFHGFKVHRVRHTLRKDGKFLDLAINFLTFFFAALYYSIKNLRGKKYDYIVVFGTSPVTTALIAINLSFFTNSKVILWVLDLWPEVLRDLNVPGSNLYYNTLRKVINYIYDKSDLILCQSETFYKKIKTNTKKLIFYTWPEKINTKLKIKKKLDQFNIVFTGNIGQAQNLMTVMKSIKYLNDENIIWHFVGGGRYKKKIVSYKNKYNLQNVKFYEYQSLSKVKKFLQIADIMLLSLIKGEATSNTIPGKFQTYLLFKKPILCHANGIVKDYVERFKLGLCSSPDDSKKLAINVLKLKEAKKKNNFNKYCNFRNFDFLLKKFSKKKILSEFNDFIIKYRPIKEIKCITKTTINKHNNKNFILSALNLAFLGSMVEKKITITNNLICWPDGLMAKLIFKKNLYKIPGRKIIEKIKFKKEERIIQIVGNLTPLNRVYLKKKFPGKKIINIPLPYGSVKILKKSLKNKVKNGIIFLTLPTPKQEIVANYLASVLTKYKIYCIGGAFNMLSGEEPPVPKIFEENMEFLWRLRFDTKRRVKRLIKNSFFMIYGLIFKKFNLEIKKI
jgi:colanic acid biosynthesis glycosyl transferase WcaI